MITVKAIRDHARSSDGKRVAIKGNRGIIEDVEKWSDSNHGLITVKWEGQRRRTLNVPKDALFVVEFGIWVPSDHCWMPNGGGEPARFSTEAEAQELIDGEDSFVIAEMVVGPWAPPKPWTFA